MRNILLLLIILTSYTQANTLPFQTIFYDENSQINYEGENFKIQTNEGNEYLNYHNILETLRLNPYLYNPNFEIGVMDSGIYSNHEDFHTFYSGFLGGEQTSIPEHYHGNMVSSLFGHSQITNNLGIHGIVNAKVNFINRGRFLYDEVYEKFLKGLKNKPKVVNISYTQHYCSSYRIYELISQTETFSEDDIEYLNSCDLTTESVYSENATQNHIRNFQDIRLEIQNNQDTLFVIAAGNRGVDASWEEGALYYNVDELGDISTTPEKLDNVLIVGDITNEGILKSYSNYGNTLDIVAMGTAYAASEVVIDSDGSVASIYDTKNGTSFSAPIVAGMASVLFSMDSALSPADVKSLLLQSLRTTDTRYTENSTIDTTESVFVTPIADLQQSYKILKQKLEIEVNSDISSLANLTREVNNDTSCVNLWNDGTSTRKVIGPKKSYEAKFYGDRCLYFRGNSFIIDYDLKTRTASKLYYDTVSSSKYREYMTFRHFVNNLKSAKADETWRDGYGVTLNLSGNVGCTVADNCTNGEITTAQQCENMFAALTGVNPSVMNARSNLLSNGICEFRNLDDANIATLYNTTDGGIEKIDFRDYLEQDRFTLEQYVGNNIPTDVQACIATWNSSGISRNLNDTVVDLYGYDVLYYKGNCYYKSKFNDQTIVIDTRGENVEVVINNSKIFQVIDRFLNLQAKKELYYTKLSGIFSSNSETLKSIKLDDPNCPGCYIDDPFMTAYFNVEMSLGIFQDYLLRFDFTNRFNFESMTSLDYAFAEQFLISEDEKLDKFYDEFFNGDPRCPEFEIGCPQGINSFITVEYPIH